MKANEKRKYIDKTYLYSADALLTRTKVNDILDKVDFRDAESFERAVIGKISAALNKS